MALSLHEPSLTKNDEEFVLDALRSGWVSTGGPYVDRFEKELAEFAGAPFGISVSNGTVGLQLILECLKRQSKVQGTFHVLCPALTFAATWNAVIHAGGIPVLVDVAAGTMNMDPVSLSTTVNRAYRQSGSGGPWVHKDTGSQLLAVMPTHIMGWTPKMNEIASFCKEASIALVEDSSESLGARYLDGKHVGQHGVASVFSFNGNKILTTGGGGMVVSANAEFAKLAKHLSTTAKTNGLRYEHDQSGFNFRLVNILAALGCSQLAGLPEMLVKKERVASWYKSESKSIRGLRFHEEHTCKTNHWINNFIFDSEGLRERALSALLEQDIQCRPLWTPGHKLKYINDLQPSPFAYPNAETIWKTALSLPSSASLSENEVGRVVQVVKSALQT